MNAVDHLGTVAYKLTDLLERQTSDVSTMDLKISTLNQVITNIFEISCLNKQLSNGVEVTYLLTCRDFLHAKFTRTKKVFGNSSCWLSFLDIISTIFCQVGLTTFTYLSK